jgi:hypothetical protein
MTLENLVNQLLGSLGGTDRSILEEQYGLWDLFSPKIRRKKTIKMAGNVSENEAKSARAALLGSGRQDQVEQFFDHYYRIRFQEDKIHARNIWNRDSLLEPVLVGGEKREFNSREAIAYWLISDVFYEGKVPFKEKLQHCPGELLCSTEETGGKIEAWHATVRSLVEQAGGALAWSDLPREMANAGSVLSDDDNRLMTKFIRFCGDFTITERQEIQLSPSDARGTANLSKGLQLYLRARKFPAPFEEISQAYRMPRWILLACLLGRTDMFTLLSTGEFRLITR